MKLQISNDKLVAHVLLEEHDIKYKPSKQAVLNLLEQNSVVYGIHVEDWENEYERVIALPAEEHKIIVASGDAPKEGKDGWIEYFFDTTTQPEFIEDEKGHIDFHELNLLHNVTSQQELLKLHEPTNGINGKDIFGEEITALDGKPTSLPKGNNIEISMEDPSVMVASIDGIVRKLRNNDVIVDDVYKVSGDVDYSTGNIKVNGTVLVSGDVKSGFEIVATGDVTVRGTVEDAHIKSERDVTIKKGFVGHGKGEVHAKGLVVIGHVVNQIVETESDIIINGEVIQAKLKAAGSIVIKGTKGDIIGGRIQAGTFVHAHDIGSLQYIKTDIIIGVHDGIKEEIKKLEEQIETNEQYKIRVKKGITNLIRIQIAHKTLPPEKEAVLAELKKARSALDAQINEMTAQLDELKQKQAEWEALAEVKVRGDIFQGTFLRFKSSVFPVRHKITRETIAPSNFYEFMEKQIKNNT